MKTSLLGKWHTDGRYWKVHANGYWQILVSIANLNALSTITYLVSDLNDQTVYANRTVTSKIFTSL